MPAIITLLVNFRVCKSQKMAQSLLPLDPRPCGATLTTKMKICFWVRRQLGWCLVLPNRHKIQGSWIHNSIHIQTESLIAIERHNYIFCWRQQLNSGFNPNWYPYIRFESQFGHVTLSIFKAQLLGSRKLQLNSQYDSNTCIPQSKLSAHISAFHKPKIEII